MKRYFPELVGNAAVKERIGRAIDEGNVPHAFLIEGPVGSGKSTLARMIAMALNCEARGGGGMLSLFGGGGDALPCGGCDACRRIREGNFTDFKILARREGRATVGVDEVRDLREDIFLSATESDHKVYVLDDAECMTPEAQNALLKVLEEPPSGVVMILLATESDRILTTVKSRVQLISMSRFSAEELESELLRRSPEAVALKRESPEKLRAVIMAADGILGRAIELSDPRLAAECADERRECIEIIAAAQRSGYSQIYRALGNLPTKRSELIRSLERMMLALRDLVAVRSDEGARTLFFISRDEALETAGDMSVQRMLALFDAINEAHEYISKNANVGNIITNLAGKIKFI